MPDTETEAIAELIENAADPVVLYHVEDPYSGERVQTRVYGRDNGQARLIDTIEVERYSEEPRQNRGTVVAWTVDGLIRYAQRHVDVDRSTLWVDAKTLQIAVVLNDHPGWADHRVVVGLETTRDWSEWAARSDQWSSQVEFAEFLDEHAEQVIEPDAASMLEVARSFHATVGATFRRAHNDASGAVEFVYEEEVKAGAGASGTTEIPREFVVSLEPFDGAGVHRIEGRFRYRIRDGRLVLGFRLLNLESVLLDAFEMLGIEAARELALEAIEAVAPSPRR